MAVKLTQQQRDAIRTEYAAGGVYQRDLARKYGVSQCAVWGVLHPERVKASFLRWRQNNAERDRENSRTWQSENTDRVRKHVQDYRARAAQASGQGYPPEAWRQVCFIWGGCAYCKQDTALTLDHVVPLSRGGSHEPANLVPACSCCNISKSNHLLSEWRNAEHLWVESFAAEVAQELGT